MSTTIPIEISHPSPGPVLKPTELSYASGPTDVPLLRETIGENLRRTAERFARL